MIATLLGLAGLTILGLHGLVAVACVIVGGSKRRPGPVAVRLGAGGAAEYLWERDLALPTA